MTISGISGPACREIRHLLGVYVVGAIDPAERSTVDEHLGECQACRDELAGLAGLPAMLSRVPVADVERLSETPAALPEPAQPSDELLNSLLSKVAMKRRTRLWRGAVAVAAAAVIAAGGAVTAIELTGSGAARTEVATASAPGGPSAVVDYTPTSWGTAMRVQVAGISPGTTCQFWVVGKDGKTAYAGTWTVTAAYSYTSKPWYSASLVGRRQLGTQLPDHLRRARSCSLSRPAKAGMPRPGSSAVSSHDSGTGGACRRDCRRPDRRWRLAADQRPDADAARRTDQLTCGSGAARRGRCSGRRRERAGRRRQRACRDRQRACRDRRAGHDPRGSRSGHVARCRGRWADADQRGSRPAAGRAGHAGAVLLGVLRAVPATRRILADVAGMTDGVAAFEIDAESRLDLVRAAERAADADGAGLAGRRPDRPAGQRPAAKAGRDRGDRRGSRGIILQIRSGLKIVTAAAGPHSIGYVPERCLRSRAVPESR